MNSRILLKSQRNEILGLIINHDFDPSRFLWVETPSSINPEFIISRLIYNDGDFFYSFEMEGEVHVAVFSPAEQSYIGSDYPGTWMRQKQSFSKWLTFLKKEEAEPDLWSDILQVDEEEKQITRKASYVVTEPTPMSPGQDEMESRLRNLLKKPSDTAKTNSRPTIKRYYGKA